jgi:hypothetical protein
MSNKIVPINAQFDEGSERSFVRASRGKKTIEQWLSEKANDADKKLPLSNIVLEHIVNGSATQIHNKSVGQNPFDAREVAKTFYDIAVTDCQDLSGNHTYRILVFYGDDAQPAARHMFNVQGQLDPDFLASEAPNQNGLLSHGMAYSGKALSLAFAQIAQLVDSTNEQLRILSTSNARLIQENMSTFEVVKSMLVEKIESENSKSLELMKYQRSSEERKRWMSQIPAIVNSITGRKILSEENSLIDQFASLPPESLEQLQSVLAVNPQLLSQLGTRIEQALNEKEKPEHAREEEISRQLPPEDELAALPSKRVVEQERLEKENAELRAELAEMKNAISELTAALKAPTPTVEPKALKKAPTKKGTKR